MQQLQQITAILDIDPAVYACAFAAQHKRYAYFDEEGSCLVDFRVKKTASRGWCALTEPRQEGEKETIHATAYSRAELMEAMDLRMKPYEREQYLHVEPLEHALKIAKSMLKNMVKQTQCEAFIGAMSRGQTFRHAFATMKEYKGNRKNTERPVFYQEVRDYFQKEFNVVVCESYEADDFLASICWANKDKAICASIDKDLDTVPGDHYKHNQSEDEDKWYRLTTFEAMYNFYKQMLEGDRVDNIPGISGIGPKKAAILLDECKTVADLHEAVCKAYQRKFGDAYEYSHWKLDEIDNLRALGDDIEEEDAMRLAELVEEMEEHPTGFEMTRTWKEIMDEMGVLLWMVRDPQEPYWTTDFMETIIPELDKAVADESI